jgi:replicative DNA helicase
MKLFNAQAEENILIALLSNGVNGLIAVEGFDLQISDFASEQSQSLFFLLKSYLEQSPVGKVDTAIIKFHAKSNNINDLDHDYLDTLSDKHIQITDIPIYAKAVKICALVRRCSFRATQLVNDLKVLTSNTEYDSLCKLSDTAFEDFNNILANVDVDSFRHIYETVADNLEAKIQGKKKVGLVCKKWKIWMQMIGGSFRRGSLNVISGFIKSGKSALSLAIAEDVASQGYKTFYIDTELDRDYQGERLLASRTNVPLKRIEYATFINNPEEEAKIKAELAINKSSFPLFHFNASGRLLDDMVMAIKRWVITQVGKDKNGNTNDCLVVFDYLKVASHKEYKANIAEWQLIGIICTILHDLARKYDIPIVLAAQLNREGDIGASLRIDHLCSTRTNVLRKSKEEKILHGQYGNRKLGVVFSRFCDFDSDEFLHVNMSEETGEWKEHGLHSQLSKNLVNTFIGAQDVTTQKKKKKKANDNTLAHEIEEL